MEPALLQAMFQFNTWANEQLRVAVTGVSTDYLGRALGLWFNSALDIIAHLYSGEELWLARLSDGASPERPFSAADVVDTPQLVAAWRELDTRWEEYVADLTPAQLEEVVRWTGRQGEAFGHMRWQLVTHVALHGHEHRAHAATAITQLGLAYGPQDFLAQFMPGLAQQPRLRRRVG